MPSFAEFERRADRGEHLSVVFFGASLTWGANASDPPLTSYRARVAEKLIAAFPNAHFRFWDAAIGGTSSQLGAFRLDRDVLSKEPDLVFLDFSANDDIYTADAEKLASYEALIRRILVEAQALVVPVIFPFRWNVESANLEAMKRRTAHKRIAEAYNLPVGDAIELSIQLVRSGETNLITMWPFDGVHPGNGGYSVFADAAWAGFQDGIDRRLTCTVPEKMLHGTTYMRVARVKLSSLTNSDGAYPAGWKKGRPHRTSAFFDMLMSRWLDDAMIASSHGAETIKPYSLKFHGRMALLFGESATNSGHYRVTIDGKSTEYDAGALGRPSHGNTHHVHTIAQRLADGWHTLEIQPLLKDGEDVRLESVCVAGDDPQVVLQAAE